MRAKEAIKLVQSPDDCHLLSRLLDDDTTTTDATSSDDEQFEILCYTPTSYSLDSSIKYPRSSKNVCFCKLLSCKMLFPKPNGRLMLAIILTAFGAAFPYGYNLGVINLPQE